MKPEEVLVGGILAIVLGLLTYMAGSTFAKSGAPEIEVALLCATIILGGLAFGGVVKLLPKAAMLTCLALALVALVALGLLHYRLVPVCGDDVCSVGECGSCVKDCSAQQCADNVCDAPKERCDSSPDCACAPGAVCSPSRGNAEPRGCAPVSCGDGFCDAGESAEGCCTDCACANGFICQSNKCIFQRPKVSINPFLLTGDISAASLAANPMLTNSSGGARPLAALRIGSTGYASGMNVTFTVPGVISQTVPVGFLRGGDEVPVLWFPRPDARLLAITEDRKTNITIAIAYLDAQGDRHSAKLSLPLLLRSRNTLDEYGHIVAFVTTDVRTRATTPAGIWDEVRSDMTLEPETGQVRFPLETLQERRGSARDIALLLTSAYENAGVQTALVEGTDHALYVRVRAGERFVMIDPARLNETFEKAVISRPGAALYELRKVRAERNITRLALNKSYLPGGDVTAKTALEQECVCAGSCATRAVVLHTITNNGFLPADVCATSIITGTDGEQRDTRKSCYSIPSMESVDLRHGWRGTVCETVSAQLTIAGS